MAHLKKDELEFLIQLENELGEEENWSPRVERLWRIVERHLNENKKTNKKTREAIAEKRKTDKNYARSK